MKFIRKHSIFNIFWFMMSFHILNYSIDCPDPQPNYIPEDLSYNDMESIVEVFLEQILSIPNAVSEHDENDMDEDSILTTKKCIDFYYYQRNTSFPYLLNSFLLPKLSHYTDTYSTQFHPEIIPPPPKV
jgi:hypothetical protein